PIGCFAAGLLVDLARVNRHRMRDHGPAGIDDDQDQQDGNTSARYTRQPVPPRTQPFPHQSLPSPRAPAAVSGQANTLCPLASNRAPKNCAHPEPLPHFAGPCASPSTSFGKAILPQIINILRMVVSPGKTTPLPGNAVNA